MLRDSWAGERLSGRRQDLPFRRIGHRPKRVLPIRAEDTRFVPSLAINEIWVMDRGRGGRAAHSSLWAEDSAPVLVQVIKAAMPLLFSARFPLEHSALMTTAQRLIRECPAYRIQTGLDLVERPLATLEQLFSR